MVNFTYDANADLAVAYVSAIRDVTIELIYPLISLSLHQARSVFYPMNHRQWAQQGTKRWQSVDIEACIPEPGLGFVCEGNSFRTSDMCLNSPSGVCHFSVHPNEHAEKIFMYVRNGCVCLQSSCPFEYVLYV